MTRGVSVQKNGGTMVAIPAMSASWSVNRSTVTEDAFNRATQTAILGGTYSVTGSISAAYRPTALETLNLGVLGSNSTGNIDTTGDFDGDGDNCAGGFNINYGGNDTNDKYSFTNCVFNSMELTLNANEYAKVTYNWIGRMAPSSHTAPTAITTAYNEDIPVFYNAVLNYDGTIKAKGVTLKIDRPITPTFALGSEYARKFDQSGQLAVSGSLSLSSAEYTKLQSSLATGDEAHPNIDASTSPTNANSISKATLTITLQKSNGSAAIKVITVSNVGITEASLNIQGMNALDKSINWIAQISEDDDLTFV